MEFISEGFLKKYLLNFAFILSLIFSLILLWKYLIPYFTPFLIAYILSLMLRPIIRWFDRAGIRRWISGVLCTFFLYFGIGSGVYFIIRCLFIQLSDFATNFLESPGTFFAPISEMVNNICEKYPKLLSAVDLEGVRESVFEKAAGYVGGILEKTAALAMNTPDILLFLFATVFSTYYFVVSYKMFNGKVDILPKSVRAIFFYCKNLFVKYLKHYLISMLTMLIIVFFLLMIGFWIMDLKYFVIISLVVALIDMLPVLGVGTVLVPWSIYYFIDNDIPRGIGMLILYIIILSVRQLIEPRLIGKKVGLSPFVTLITVYVGYKVMGIVGIILAPFFAMVVSSIIKEIFDTEQISKKSP